MNPYITEANIEIKIFRQHFSKDFKSGLSTPFNNTIH